jgi:hypothetical protein
MRGKGEGGGTARKMPATVTISPGLQRRVRSPLVSFRREARYGGGEPAMNCHRARDVAHGDLVRELLHSHLLILHEPRATGLDVQLPG